MGQIDGPLGNGTWAPTDLLPLPHSSASSNYGQCRSAGSR